MLSNLKVLQKLGVIGVLFLLAVGSAIYFYSSGVTDRVIRPAEDELEGVALNLKVIETQKKFAKFYLEVQRGVQNGSTNYQTAGDEAFEAYRDLKSSVEEVFGKEVGGSLLSPIDQAAYTEPFSKGPPQDDFKDIFDRTLPEFANVARGIAQQTHIFQDDDPGAIQAVSISYDLMLPLASDITGVAVHSMEEDSGGGDVDEDALDGDMDELGGSGFGSALKTRLEVKAEQLGQAAGRITDPTVDSPFLKKAKSFPIPDADNFSGDPSESIDLSDQAYDFAKQVHEELRQRS